MREFGTPPEHSSCVPRNAAYAVIQNADGQIAVIEAAPCGTPQLWLPGGGMHEGETPSQTIVREVHEELGREAVVGSEIGAARQYFYAGDKGFWHEMTAWFFLAQFAGEAHDAGEFDLHWVNPAEKREAFFHECHVWAALAVIE